MKLSIADISKSSYEENIYVINTSSGKTRGSVVFNCHKQDGRNIDTITIPDTFLPIDLIDFVSKKQVLESSDFKNAVRKGLLTLIDVAEAKEIESQPGAKEERDRINDVYKNIDLINSGAYGDGSEVVTVHETGNKSSNALNLRMQSILENADTSGEVVTMNSLRSIVNDLTIKDLRHIRTFAKNNRMRNLFEFSNGEVKRRKAKKMGVKA